MFVPCVVVSLSLGMLSSWQPYQAARSCGIHCGCCRSSGLACLYAPLQTLQQLLECIHITQQYVSSLCTCIVFSNQACSWLQSCHSGHLVNAHDNESNDVSSACCTWACGSVAFCRCTCTQKATCACFCDLQGLQTLTLRTAASTQVVCRYHGVGITS